VKSEAVKKVLRIIERLHKDTLNKIAVINLPKNIPRDIKRKISRFRERLIISPHFLMSFSGTIIRANVLKDKGIKIREGFFLDQADFDFFYRLKRLGFLTCIYVDELLEHKLGVPLLIGRKLLIYENSWRYYLIVRNSTILLLEGVIPPLFYFSQLIGFLYPLWLVEGFRKALKSLITGLAHGLFKKEGCLDPIFFKISLLKG
jgi:GT2 family glycosyltransferase